MYFNPYLTTKPKPTNWANVPAPQTNWGSQDIFAPGQFSAGAQLDQFGNSLPQMPQQDGGPNWGGIATGVTGMLSLAEDAVGMANQPLGIETQAPGLERSATGEPVYSGAFRNQASNAKPQGATGGEVLAGAGKGAATGAMVGSVVPVIGTAIGAIGGAIIGGLSSAFGGGARKRRQRDQQRSAMRSARNQQKMFNEASASFDATQNSQADYLRRMNNTNRLWNLYGA